MIPKSTKVTLVPSERVDRPDGRRKPGEHIVGEGDEVAAREVAWPPSDAEIAGRRAEVEAEAGARNKRIRYQLETEFANGKGVARWLVEPIPPDPCAPRP